MTFKKSGDPKSSKKLPRTVMLKNIAPSGLSDKTIKTAGFRPLAAADTTKLKKQRARSYLIPYFNRQGELTDFWRIRYLDTVYARDSKTGEYITDKDGNKKEQRYDQPAGSTPVYYPPDFNDKDPAREIIICEGEKKALLLSQEGYRAVAVPGVWNWGADNHLNDDLRTLAAEGNTFWIVYDGNVHESWKNIDKGRRRLADALTDVNASAWLVDLPDTRDLDTWYLASGSTHKERRAAFNDVLRSRYQLKTPSVVNTLEFRKLDTSVLRKPPPARSYVLEPWIGAGLLTFIAGTGGMGKTMLMLDLAVHVAVGAHLWMGMKVTPGRVVIITLEDPIEEVMRRLYFIVAAYCTTHTLNVAGQKKLHEKLADNLRIESVEGKVLRLLVEKDHNIERTNELVPLALKLAALTPSLIVIDPLSQLHTLNENDNSVGSAVVSALGFIRTETGAAVAVPAHTNKESDKYKGRGRDTMAGVRGASSIVFGGRSVVCLSILDATEASQTFQVEAKDAHDRFARFSHVKNNYGPKYHLIYAERGPEGVWLPSTTPFRDLTTDANWVVLLRAWAAARDQPWFSKRDITDTHRAEVFGASVGKPKAVQMFKQAAQDGVLRVLTDKELEALPAKSRRGGGKKYLLERGK